MRELEGKVCVVTGAGRGIGRALANGFAKEGAKVCCSARTESQIKMAASAINATGATAVHIVCDVANLSSVELLFKRVEEHFGGVDIVVANAGIGPDNGTVADGDPDKWKAIIDSNLLGTYHTARSAIPYLRRRGEGKLIVVGSGLGHRGSPQNSAYACSKAGTWMLARILAQELAPFNICVNELIPGPVDTDILRSSMSPEDISKIRQMEWVKSVEDVVPLALFLASQPAMGPTAQSFSLMRREN